MTALESAPQPLKVLIVDDNHDASTVLARLLQKSGHVVREAPDAIRAMDDAIAFSPDCVISDLCMPDVDGYELARRLRRHGAFGKTLLIAYSATPDADAARDAGFDYCFAKPTAVKLFYQALDELKAMKKQLDQVEQVTRQQGQVVSEVRELMIEVRQDVREIKTGLQEEVKELKSELREIKEDIRELKAEQNDSSEPPPAVDPS